MAGRRREDRPAAPLAPAAQGGSLQTLRRGPLRPLLRAPVAQRPRPPVSLPGATAGPKGRRLVPPHLVDRPPRHPLAADALLRHADSARGTAEPQPRLQEKCARGGSDGKSNDLENSHSADFGEEFSDGRSGDLGEGISDDLGNGLRIDLGRTRPSKLREPHGARDGSLVRAHSPAALPISARVAMRSLQPARAAAPSPWRTALDHGGLLRLLGHALLGAQGCRHPLGHDAPRRRGATAPRPPRSPLHALPHVSRRRRPGERLFLQLRDLLPGLVHHHLPPGCKDFSDYYLSINKIEKSS